MFTIMDATPDTSLPPGGYDTHIPQWMLPAVPPATLCSLRPDLLLIEGLTIADLHCYPPARLANPAFLLDL